MIEITAVNHQYPEGFVVSPQFARAEYFVITNNGMAIGSIPNIYRDAPGNAAEMVVSYLKIYNPDVVKAGNFGNNAIYALEREGIKWEKV